MGEGGGGGGGGGVAPYNGLHGEERFRTPVKAKPQLQTSEGRVSRIISRPGSVESSISTNFKIKRVNSSLRQEERGQRENPPKRVSFFRHKV